MYSEDCTSPKASIPHTCTDFGGHTRHSSDLAREYSVLRTSSVEDVEQASLIINGHLLTVGVFNGRIVLIDEVVLDELDRKGRLADTTTA